MLQEHSFELFLFAELFHEMLQRDFGFQIYKSLCEAPEKVKEEEKVSTDRSIAFRVLTTRYVHR